LDFSHEEVVKLAALKMRFEDVEEVYTTCWKVSTSKKLILESVYVCANTMQRACWLLEGLKIEAIHIQTQGSFLNVSARITKRASSEAILE